MDYFNDVYLKRLNRYGLDYQTRVQTQRERAFEQKLLKSVYRVDFLFNGEETPGTLERYEQDETKLLAYLLTRVSTNIPAGTILMIPDKDFEEQPWMVFFLESMKASGYNRYILLKMTHYITWKDAGEEYSSWAYMFGKQSGALLNSIESSSTGTVYSENSNENFFVMPLNEKIKRDIYLEVGEDNLKEAYRVTGYDIQSTPGVQYVTIDPVYLRDHSKKPEKTEVDKTEDFFWFEGGAK